MHSNIHDVYYLNYFLFYAVPPICYIQRQQVWDLDQASLDYRYVPKQLIKIYLLIYKYQKFGVLVCAFYSLSNAMSPFLITLDT